MPKLITKAELEEEKPKVTQKPEEQKPNNQKKETDEKQSTRVQEELEKIEQPKKDHERYDKKKEEFSWPDGISEVKEKEKEVGNGMKKENGSLALDKSQQRKLLINVAVAFMVLVGLGMYVTFKMSTS